MLLAPEGYSPPRIEIRSPLEKIGATLLLGRPNERITKNPDYQQARPIFRQLYTQAGYWHGTGRYQYRDGQARDILDGIIAQNGIIPHRDGLDPTKGVMQSTSLSPARMYARIYAGLHYPKGEYINNQCGSLPLWWSYYLGNIALAAVSEDRSVMSRKARQILSTESQHFHDKRTQQPISKKDYAKGGISDIEGNYPILIGIREECVVQTDIGKWLQRHETRASNSILIPGLTHMEVPESEVKDVSNKLKASDIQIPVLSLEWGEEYCRTLPLNYLLNGGRLEK